MLTENVADAPKPHAITQVDPAQSRDAAATLTALLSELDPAAIECLESNYAALRPLFADTTWPVFEDLVRGYAFADAQAQLELALKNGTLSTT